MFLSEWREFPLAPCLARKKLDDSSSLDVVEFARVPEMLPSLFPSWLGYGLTSTPVYNPGYIQSLDRAMAQTLSRQHLTAESRVPCGICQYYSTNALYSSSQ